MIARRYEPQDAAALDALLAGDHEVRLDRDYIAVVGEVGRPVGLIAARAAALVHELRVGKSLVALKRVEALVNFGMGWMRQVGMREAIFMVDPDNTAMLRYLDSIGAKRERPAVFYTLDFKG